MTRFPDWVLLRYRLGELPEDRAREVREAVDRDPDLARRLAEFDQQERALMLRVPPRTVAAHVRERPSRGERAGRPWRMAVPALAVAALALIFLVPDEAPESPAREVRAKGASPYLRVFRKVSGGMEELRPGDPAHAGDTLQLHYASLGRPWGAVFSVDGDGTVTWHLPQSGGAAVALATEGTVALGASYELDEAPAFERFYFVTSSNPFSLDAEAPHRHLDDELEVDSFELRKLPAQP